MEWNFFINCFDIDSCASYNFENILRFFSYYFITLLDTLFLKMFRLYFQRNAKPENVDVYCIAL